MCARVKVNLKYFSTNYVGKPNSETLQYLSVAVQILKLEGMHNLKQRFLLFSLQQIHLFSSVAPRVLSKTCTTCKQSFCQSNTIITVNY